MDADAPGSALLLLDLGLWIGGLILGFVAVVAGAAAGSSLAVRLGFLIMTAGMTGSAVVRALAFRTTGRVRVFAVISVGFRLAAAMLFLYLALNFQLSAKTSP